jgi:hypothetical protein
MVQGSTGGAGISSDSINRITEGEPVSLDATLLYVSRRGERAGEVVAYDEITVGGFGLASVTLERTVLRPGAEPTLAPGEQGPPATPGTTPSPSGTPGSTPGAPPASGGTPGATGSATPPG